MEKYIALKIESESPEQLDAWIAYLAEAGFEGFEELPSSLIAYRVDDGWDASQVEEHLKELGCAYTLEILEKTNWNQLWESNFEPVRIDDFVGIRAEFHEPITDVLHELLITPKMSFGTGHHATTRLMVQSMRSLIRFGDRVLDFGTGTGVLAILSKKLGSAETIGIDIEDWSVENANDNAWVNQVDGIQFICSDRIEGLGLFDRILANINLNVLLENMDAMKLALSPQGTLLMSGILQEDLVEMDLALERVGLKRTSLREERGWICIQVIHYQSAV